MAAALELSLNGDDEPTRRRRGRGAYKNSSKRFHSISTRLASLSQTYFSNLVAHRSLINERRIRPFSLGAKPDRAYLDCPYYRAYSVQLKSHEFMQTVGLLLAAGPELGLRRNRSRYTASEIANAKPEGLGRGILFEAK